MIKLPFSQQEHFLHVTGLRNFFFVLQDLIDRINSCFHRKALQRNFLLIGFKHSASKVFSDENKWPLLQHKLVRRNYSGKLSVSIKYQNLHFFKEGMIHFCQSILETRRISHLHGSAFFSVPLTIANTICSFGLHSNYIDLCDFGAVGIPFCRYRHLDYYSFSSSHGNRRRHSAMLSQMPSYVGFMMAKNCCHKGFHICGLSFQVLQCC